MTTPSTPATPREQFARILNEAADGIERRIGHEFGPLHSDAVRQAAREVLARPQEAPLISGWYEPKTHEFHPFVMGQDDTAYERDGWLSVTLTPFTIGSEVEEGDVAAETDVAIPLKAQPPAVEQVSERAMLWLDNMARGGKGHWNSYEYAREILAALSQSKRPMTESEEYVLAIKLAWGIIANSNGGNWEDKPKGWIEAAERWRDTYVNKMYEARAASRTSEEPKP